MFPTAVILLKIKSCEYGRFLLFVFSKYDITALWNQPVKETHETWNLEGSSMRKMMKSGNNLQD